MAALIVSSILNIIYLLPISVRAFMKPAANPDADLHLVEERKKHRWVIVPPVISALGALILFFFAGSIVDFLQPIISGGG